MKKLIIDQDALVAYLKKELSLAVTAEEGFSNGNNYEDATRCRERRYVLGNLLLLMITGDEHFSPVTIDDGGFMIPVSNIRSAISNMTDEELIEMFKEGYTLVDNKLASCSDHVCTSCPVKDADDGDCEKNLERYMAEEAER